MHDLVIALSFIMIVIVPSLIAAHISNNEALDYNKRPKQNEI